MKHMDMNDPKIKTFIEAISSSHEAALLIIEDPDKLVEVQKTIHAFGYISATTSVEILKLLESDAKICYTVENITKDLYDIVRQYSAGGGMIQLFNVESEELTTTRFHQHITKLIIIVSRDTLKNSQFPLMQYIGITEIID